MANKIKKLMRRQAALQKAILKLQQNLSLVQNELNAEFLNCLPNPKAEVQNLEDIMSAKEVCEMLEISPSTLRRMELYKGFPYMRIPGNKKLLFSRKEILAYLNKHKANNDD